MGCYADRAAAPPGAYFYDPATGLWCSTDTPTQRVTGARRPLPSPIIERLAAVEQATSDLRGVAAVVPGEVASSRTDRASIRQLVAEQTARLDALTARLDAVERVPVIAAALKAVGKPPT